MKRIAKMLMVTCVAALALAAVASSASAATSFTASATGELTSHSTTGQRFTVTGFDRVDCTTAHGTGPITATKTTSQHMTVKYSGCTGFIFGVNVGEVDISNATYNFTPNGEVHLLNEVTINVTSLGCEIFVTKGQTLKSVSYTNSSPISTITVTANVTGIKSTQVGGCPSGTNGTYTGTNVSSRVGGGTVSVD